MTVHKLSVGDGYTYLTRQVAGSDVQRRQGQSASDYYTQGGNPPGRWFGSGLQALGLVEGGRVNEAQMRNLFGEGRHPEAERILKDYLDKHLKPSMTDAAARRVEAEAQRAVKLGQQFPRYATLEPFSERVAARLAQILEETGRPATIAETAKVKREEAVRQRTSVAGYDLVFTPVKSISLLWALHPDQAVRDQIRAGHEAAVGAVVAMLEQHAAFTRSGVGGVAQIETRGLVTAAFDHFDSRAGDPDLHTHLAIVNKVQGVDGKWRALDGTALFALGVAASETYNSTVEAELTARLGVVFANRPGQVRGKQPVREIVGVAPELVKYFSSRRVMITSRYNELQADYRSKHGREPDAKTIYELAQQATLETRGAKAAPRSLERMRTDWIAQVRTRFAPRVLEGLSGSVNSHLEPIETLTPPQISELAGKVVRTVAEQRATWTRWNIHAETMRSLRGAHLFSSPGAMRDAADQIVTAALGEGNSIRISVPAPVEEPQILRRSDGVPVFTKHETHRYTSEVILSAEQRLLTAASTPTVFASSSEAVRNRLSVFERESGRVLDRGQRNLVEAFAVDERLLTVGIGPAGSGKTTAMRAFRNVLAAEGRRLVGLAPSANAAKVLESDLGVRCDTIDKMLWTISPGNLLSGPELVESLSRIQAASSEGGAYEQRRLQAALNPLGLRPGDVLLIDEASMAGTLNLDRTTAVAGFFGAQVRLLGDTQQLGAVASGGAMRLIANKVGAVELTELHRFTDPAFAEASLKLRDGDSAGLDYFEERGRLIGGTEDAMVDALYGGWRTDLHAGKITLMLAHRNETVARLSERARTDRIAAGEVRAKGIQVADGNTAGRGDWVVTRSNNSLLKFCKGKDHVRNGYTWTIMRTYRDGSMKVKSHKAKGTMTLPADYVAEHVELAYAATINRSQGMNVDTMHPLLSEGMTRNAFYVLSTRAAEQTTLYTVTHTAMPIDPDDRTWRPGWDPDSTAAREVAEQILATEPDDLSATESTERAVAETEKLANLVPQYRFAADLAAKMHYEKLLEQTVRARMSADQWKSFLETGTGPVARVLASAESEGWNASQLLEMVTHRSLSDADAPAAVLVSRIKKLTGNHPAPPPGLQPEARDIDYYARLIRAHDPRLNLDPAIAIKPPTTGKPATAANAVDGRPNAIRFKSELASVLGPAAAFAVAAERGWPVLVGALSRAEDSGQHAEQALRRALAQRDLDGLATVSEVISWRLDRQTRLIAHDPTHSGQAWPAIAWTLKAWEVRTGQDAAHLVDELAPGRDLTDLAVTIAGTLAYTVNKLNRMESPTSLPWLDYPRQVLDSDAVTKPLRDYLASLGSVIRDRTANLEDATLGERPEWAQGFAVDPADPVVSEHHEAALRIAAAYRDQFRVADGDRSRPLGPYPESGRAGHREWWASVASVAAANTVEPGEFAAVLGRKINQDLLGAIARDLYQSLPEPQKNEVHVTISARLDQTAVSGLVREPGAVVCHPLNTQHLLETLAGLGHLDPNAAAGIGIVNPGQSKSAGHTAPSAGDSPRIEAAVDYPPELDAPQVRPPASVRRSPTLGP